MASRTVGTSGGRQSPKSSRVCELERQRDNGRASKPGANSWTVEKWLSQWVENVAAPSVRESTLTRYRAADYKHLIPGRGAHQLRKLEPEHLEKVYAKMAKAGAKPGTVHQVHRTAKTALAVAVDREHLARNPTKLAKVQRLDEDEIVPLTAAEAKRVLAVARHRRNGARFVIALALGLRRGEALGLKWSRLDLDAGLLRTPRQLQGQKWKHGWRPARVRRTAPQDEAVPTDMHEAHEMPASLPAQMHAACQLLPGTPRRRVTRGRREVEGRTPDHRHPGTAPRIVAHARGVAERRALFRRHRMARRRLGVHPADRPAARSTRGSRRVEDVAGGGERSRCSAARRRHTAATMLLVLRVLLPAIMEVMGVG
ncbi:site-specific integrase [Amycolatopsis sp. FDAARGOS 1241]|uniref:tyrosine-type recombinase/integrase n=1 Tax=Amycolatopsis sp. FDAARGOS 1241 TaxID=2778070 RepID=UPI001EF29518|nr:site-specific integrase [Amycolatopsis sp. FDAARGOS 1241]